MKTTCVCLMMMIVLRKCSTWQQQSSSSTRKTVLIFSKHNRFLVFFLFSRLASLFSQMEQNFAFFSNSIQTKLTLVIIKLASFLFNSVNNEKFRRNLPVTKVVVCCCCIVFGNKEFIKVGKS